jgi:hypothetical protein
MELFGLGRPVYLYTLGYVEKKYRSFSRCRFNTDLMIENIGDATNNSQAKTNSGITLSGVVVKLLEFLENLIEHVFGYADPGIPYFQPD